MFQMSAESWRIISHAPEARSGARRLLIHLAEALEVSAIGISFTDENTSYSWVERVEKVCPSIPCSPEAEILNIPFPSSSSYWFLEGFHDNQKALKPLLILLAEQWLHLNRRCNNEKKSMVKLRKPGKEALGNPAWIAVSPGAGIIRSRLRELSFSRKPILLSGENGCGKKYLAELIHSGGPNPSDPFTEPESGKTTGTLFIPDWHLISGEDRRQHLKDSRRLVAAAIPGKEAESLHGDWNERTGDQRSIIKIPPLREHREDIPMLAGRFLEKAIRNTGFQAPAISPAALESLIAYKWPGNIRELKEVMLWAVEGFDGRRITLANLPPAVRGSINLPRGSCPDLIANLEYEILREELSRQRGNISRTAHSLGLSPRQVSLRMKKYGLDPGEFKTPKLPH